MTNWSYNDQDFIDEMIGDAFGFVYCITHLESGKRYFGKKYFTKSKSIQRKKRKKHIRVSSDWKTYWGSNEQLQHDVQTLGESQFTREILKLCATRGECSYWENYYIFQSHALLQDNFYNQWTSCKIHRSHVSRLKVPNFI